MSPRFTFSRKRTKVCLAIWISAVLYSIYRFTVVSQHYFQQYHDEYGDFAPGWAILGLRKKDKADFEWETAQYLFNTIGPAMGLYLFVCELGRFLQVEKYLRVIFSLTYVTYSMGYKATLLVVAQPLIFALTVAQQSKTLIWTCSLTFLGLIAGYKQLSASEAFLDDIGLNHFQAYLNVVILCWMNLKCTSFFLTRSKYSLLDYVGYCLYFPTLFTGPFIAFEDFPKLGKRGNVKKLTLNVFGCVFWMMFLDFWLHFIYVNATGFQLELVKKLDLCTLCGYGYLMGQFFHIKYLVLYGFATSVASFDNVIVPSLPRCIGRIHLYSDMWKYFDPGLYSFLKTCIFMPGVQFGLKKFEASLLCFLFVFIWHGIEGYILIWAVLNFTGVMLEDLAYKFLKPLAINRGIKCLGAAPLLAMSAVSNFYFFAGRDVGDVFMGKCLSEATPNKLLLFLVLYCCCEVSMELRDVRARKM